MASSKRYIAFLFAAQHVCTLLIVEVGHLSPISELVVREVTGSIPVGDSESESFFVPRLCRID